MHPTRFRLPRLEATGTAPTDAVVVALALSDGEISIIGSNLIRPMIPIPPEASAIHHLTEEDLDGYPSLNPVRGLGLLFLLVGCWLAQDSRRMPVNLRLENKRVAAVLFQRQPLVARSGSLLSVSSMILREAHDDSHHRRSRHRETGADQASSQADSLAVTPVDLSGTGAPARLAGTIGEEAERFGVVNAEKRTTHASAS